MTCRKKQRLHKKKHTLKIAKYCHFPKKLPKFESAIFRRDRYKHHVKPKKKIVMIDKK